MNDVDFLVFKKKQNKTSQCDKNVLNVFLIILTYQTNKNK